MIKELTIKNFRSIREASLELGRFTILNGANNSGKSSVLYALQVLKNVVTNPNRSVDELLNLGFLNLGGLKEILPYNNEEKEVDIKVKISRGYRETIYGIVFSQHGSFFTIKGIKPYRFHNSLFVVFPHSLQRDTEIEVEESTVKEFRWNGFQVTDITFSDSTRSNTLGDSMLNGEVELPIQYIGFVDVVPTRRGFTSIVFNTIPLQSQIITEYEVATLLAVDKKLQDKVAHYFEKITGKRFAVSMSPGMGFFYLRVREEGGSFATELVNQGMGVNQILFLLAKILYDKNRLICIDEPEIHLHPTLIEQFVKVLVEIAEKEDKQFIFSTHSEHWLMSMLAEVNDGNLKAEDLKVYYLTKEGQETKVENQQVFPNGQIEGGLKNFLEAQMRLTNRFFATETA